MTRRPLTLTTVSTIGILASIGIVATGGAASAAASDHRDRAEQLLDLDHGTVVVYEDGRVYRRADMGDWYIADGFTTTPEAAPRMAPPAPPGAYEWATLSDDAVADLVEQVEQLGLLDDDLDFGDPMITDSPSSGLVLSIDGEHVHHSVYAPGYSDGLTAEQRANREAYEQLRSVLFELEDEFGEDVSKFAPFVPDAWIVRTGTYWADDVQRPWPLTEDPVEGECVELPSDDTLDTATGGYRFDGDIVVADATLPNDPRCT